MNVKQPYSPAMIILLILTAWVIAYKDRIREKHKNYNFFYKKADDVNKTAYLNFIAVAFALSGYFKKGVEIYVHTNRLAALNIIA